MTTLQKALIGTALAVAAGTGIYEAHQASRVRQQNQSLENQQGALAAQLDALQQEHDTLRKETGQSQSNQNTDEVLKLRGEVSRLRQQLAESKTARQAVDDPFAQSVQALSAKAVELNQHLEQMPEKKIPELHFLTEHDWLNAASSANFQTDADVRKALRRLRNVAKSKMPMGWSLYGYTHAHNGELPTKLSQLKPYFKTPVDDGSDSHWHGVDPERDDAVLDTILERYQLIASGNISNLAPNAWVVVEKAPVDKEYDSRGKFGIGTSTLIDTGLGESGDPDDKSY